MSVQFAIISDGIVVDIIDDTLRDKVPKSLLVKRLPAEHNVGIGNEYLMGCFIPSKKYFDFSHAVSLLSVEDLEQLGKAIEGDQEKFETYRQLCSSEKVSVNDSRLRRLFTPSQLFPIYEWGRIVS